HRTARLSSVLFRASSTCATARATDRPVPSSRGRARTTTIPPAGEGGPAWEPLDGLWGTSTSTSAMTQASSANAPDFFSSLLDRSSGWRDAVVSLKPAILLAVLISVGPPWEIRGGLQLVFSHLGPIAPEVRVVVELVPGQ